MRAFVTASLALALGLCRPSIAIADVPAALSFAGSLSTSAGGLSGPVILTFSMYADAESLDPAALLWSETLDLVSNDGAFVAMLGADPSNPFPADLLDHPALFLGVQVEDDPEMMPRLSVGSVPYAMRSADAGQLGGQPPSAYAEATHGHPMGEITGEVPPDQLPPAVVLEGDESSVSGAMLQPEAVNLWHFADMGCAEGEAVAWDDAAGAWACKPFADVVHGHAMGEITGEVPPDQLPPAVVLEGDEASVSGAMLQPGAVDLWHFADMGCAEGEAVAWDDAAGAWACKPFADVVHGHAMGEITGEVPTDQLPATIVLEGDEASVSGAMLQSGAVNLWHLADMGCAEGEAIAWDDASGAWACLPFAAATHGHTMGEITGEVPTDQLPPAVVLEGDASSVSGAMLQPGAVKLMQLGDMGCADGGALSWDDGAGSWACKPTWIWSAAGLHTPLSAGVGRSPQTGVALDVVGQARVSAASTWPPTAPYAYSTLTLGAAAGPVLTLQSQGPWGFLGTSSSTNDVVLGSTDGFRLQTDVLMSQGPITSGKSVFTVTKAGWIGIGTTTPAAHLDVYGNGTDNYYDGFLYVRAKANDAGIKLFDGDNAKWHVRNSFGDGNRLRVYPQGNLTSGLTIDQSGQVGIGPIPTDPQAALHVEDTIRVGYDASYPLVYGEISHTGGGNGFRLNAEAGGGSWGDMVLATNGTPRMFIESAGRVGIGTTAPASKLDISGDGGSVADGTLSLRNDGADTGIELYDGSKLKWSIMNTNPITTHGVLSIKGPSPWASGGLWLFDSGKMWVGSVPPASTAWGSWPTSALTVTQSTGFATLLLDGTDYGAQIALMSKGTANWWIREDIATGTLGIGRQSPTDRMSWTTSSRLGLRTSAPEAAVDVWGQGGSWPEGFLFLRNSHNYDEGIRLYAGIDGDEVKWHFFNSVTQGNKLRIAPEGNAVNGGITIDQSGNVGIGITTPDANTQLQITGTARKPGGGSWASSSDRRLKKNVHTLTGALDKLLRLRGVSYEWRNPAEHGNMVGAIMGMIAQEVREVFPEWVGTDGKGFLTLGFIGFEAITVEAIRELDDQNLTLQIDNRALREDTVALRAENQALRDEVGDLRSRLEAIEAQLR